MRRDWLLVLGLVASVPLVWRFASGRRTAPAPSVDSTWTAELPPGAQAAAATTPGPAEPRLATVAPVVIVVAIDPRVDSEALLREVNEQRARLGAEVAVVPLTLPAPGEPGATAELERARDTLRALGVTPPAVLVNARRLDGPMGLAELVDAELAAAKEAGARGAPPELWHEARARANAGPLFATYWQGLIDPAPAAEAAPRPAATVSANALFSAKIWNAAVHGREPTKGNPHALVTIVEFGDFTCEWCVRAAEVVDQLLDRYPGDVRVVWKTVVLPSHARSRAAAEAALTAHDHGKFWQMQERLFASLDQVRDADLARHGEELGIGKKPILDAIRANAHAQVLKADERLAAALDLRGAPFFFINGRRVNGFRELDDLELLVTAELDKARALVAEGVAARDVYSHILRHADADQPLSTQVHPFALEGRPTLGPPGVDLVVTLLVDYEFYPTQAWDKMARAMLEAPSLAGRVRLVIKQAPHLAHALGRQGSLAALAAHEQGKFWAMHDKLVARRGDLGSWTGETIAREIGLDMDRYAAALAAGRGKAMLDEDIAESRAAGRISGPSLFIGGRAIEDESSLTRDRLIRLVARQATP